MGTMSLGYTCLHSCSTTACSACPHGVCMARSAGLVRRQGLQLCGTVPVGGREVYADHKGMRGDGMCEGGQADGTLEVVMVLPPCLNNDAVL